MGSTGATDFDVVIQGGGPLACAIARDAVGRGLRVLLSTHGDFGGDLRQHIVSCGVSLLPDFKSAPSEETAILQRICPQIKTTHPAPKPHTRGGLFKAKETPEPSLPCGSIANRFAMLCARDAQERGAILHPNTQLDVQHRSEASWSATVRSPDGTEITTVTARVYINTIPNVEQAHPQHARVATFNRASSLDNFAKRRGDTLHFAFEADGNATDVGLIAPHVPTAQELIEQAHKIGVHGQPIWVSEPFIPTLQQSKLSIKRTPTQFDVPDTAPSGWRKQAEDVVAEIAPFAQMIGKRWTAFATLPGGDFEPALRDSLLSDLQRSHPSTDTGAVDRMFSSYGTECHRIFGAKDDLGEHFGAGLFEAEVEFLVSNEWAHSANDILWRRTLLGLHFTPDQTTGLDNWITRNQSQHGLN
jgi:hypothetical protein